jgi:RIO kinase 1
LQNDRQARRKRKPKTHHIPKKSTSDIVNDIADTTGVEVEGQELTITYQPSLYEEGWLTESLRPFFEQSLITDVLSLVKGGKEASVYCCAAHPSTGVEYLAAKVYRPRQFRSLSNDSIYREGRGILDAEGKKIHTTDRRVIRALEQKSSYGVLIAHTSWLMHEYHTLSFLRQIHVPVPTVYGSSNNALLLAFIGDTPHTAAPTLNHIRLPKAEAEIIFEEVIAMIEIMLRNEVVHGDLSAYNMLYWEGNITLIDFPQVINPHTNSNTYAILKRDIQRVCDYFAKCGVTCDAQAIMTELWERYLAPNPQDRAADLSKFEQDNDTDE